jgi:hypothetical protein
LVLIIVGKILVLHEAENEKVTRGG